MEKLKLLIVEDSKSIQFFYNKELPSDLYERIIVADGEQALAKYELWKPDIVLLDMNIPLINGYQVLKTIREEKKDLKTTVIMVTSTSDRDDVIACAKLGIQGYIVKPCTGDELREKILKYHSEKK